MAHVRNKLIELPEPGILFTHDNARWAYHALKDIRARAISVPEQDELCDELRDILWPEEVSESDDNVRT